MKSLRDEMPIKNVYSFQESRYFFVKDFFRLGSRMTEDVHHVYEEMIGDEKKTYEGGGR